MRISQNRCGIEQRIPPFLRSEKPNGSLRRKDRVPSNIVRDRGNLQNVGRTSNDLPCHEDYDGFTVVVTATSSHVPVTAGSRFSVRPSVAIDL
jgi:hypothetical protein